MSSHEQKLFHPCASTLVLCVGFMPFATQLHRSPFKICKSRTNNREKTPEFLYRVQIFLQFSFRHMNVLWEGNGIVRDYSRYKSNYVVI